jgi:hypothetical protein
MQTRSGLWPRHADAADRRRPPETTVGAGANDEIWMASGSGVVIRRRSGPEPGPSVKGLRQHADAPDRHGPVADCHVDDDSDFARIRSRHRSRVK